MFKKDTWCMIVTEDIDNNSMCLSKDMVYMFKKDTWCIIFKKDMVYTCLRKTYDCICLRKIHGVYV